MITTSIKAVTFRKKLGPVDIRVIFMRFQFVIINHYSARRPIVQLSADDHPNKEKGNFVFFIASHKYLFLY